MTQPNNSQRATTTGAGFNTKPAPVGYYFRLVGTVRTIQLYVLATFLFSVLVAPVVLAAPAFQILHGFGNVGDGSGLWSGVVLDQKGHLYGTTYGGGDDYGTVYKLARQPDGNWSEKVLYKFQKGDPNGEYPIGNLILDSAGNLYGTASQGGSNHAGTAFRMSRQPNGWAFDLLYTFCTQPDCADGAVPWAALVLDKAGNLYGTAFNVFSLTPDQSGWTESVLYNFCSQENCTDGRLPYEGVVLGPEGNLYGATHGGGKRNGGTVYKLKHTPDGSWQEHVLHSFGGPSDGDAPGSTMLVALDNSGNIYGTTTQGGTHACGVVGCGVLFRLARQPDGHWKETILHNFKLGKGGYWPGGGVVIDAAGNLYGTTGSGGSGCDCGVVYKLSLNPDNSWSYSVLHRFTGADGYLPDSNLTLDKQGNLYGTTLYGGPGDGGVVFMITQ